MRGTRSGPTRVRRLGATAVVCCGWVLLLAGCVSDREREALPPPDMASAYLADKPAALYPHLMVRLQQGVRNLVLNDMRIGLAALDIGEERLATELFDEALADIEAVYGNSAAAAEARGLWAKEAVKDFKGEPYERAMAYYYRGLSYLWAGDYQNARASFKSGVLQDAFAEEEQHRADFALLIFLEGWASHCDGADALAKESFAELAKLNPKFQAPGRYDNTLILAEAGWAPIKDRGDRRAGLTRRHLMFFPGGAAERARVLFPPAPSLDAPPVPVVAAPAPPPPSKKTRRAKKGAPVAQVAAVAADREAPSPPPARPVAVDAMALEDLQFQATTRGGRGIDAILDGKVQFKEGVGVAGDILLNSGIVLGSGLGRHSRRDGDDRAAGYAAVGLMVAGLLAKGIESAVEADADTRYWDNLPGKVHALTVALPESVSVLPVEFLNGSGTVIAPKTRTARIMGVGRCRLGWVRANPAFPIPPRAPNSAPPEIMAQPVSVPPVQARAGTIATKRYE